MALSNIKNEPRREITEQFLGLLFVILYAFWIVYSVHLSTLIYSPRNCVAIVTSAPSVCARYETGYWTDPGDFVITIGLILSVWLIYPFLLLMHFMGEVVCDILTFVGVDPRPKIRYDRYGNRRY